MVALRLAALLAVLSIVLCGCARPPSRLDAEPKSAPAAHGYVAANHSLSALTRFKFTSLTGRTLRVGSIDDIKLRKGEVVLTFDDGPSPQITTAILDALDKYKVKATFLSVGRMVDAHPETIREVARRGHSVGTHTHDHANLRLSTYEGAMKKISRGYASLQKALAPIGKKPAPFFRFPYLSDTKLLRTSLADENMVVLDVDIDSEDYRAASPEAVVDRTLRRIEAKGRGVILFHDIQSRTAIMLPAFLQALDERGYEVVHLVPGGRGLFGVPLVTATLE